jgi:hypothetical protein
LPNIITNFALLIITLWTGATITETVFLWPGLGRTLYQAVGLYDIPIIVGSTIIYAYMLALTVFLLDFVYALVDPSCKNRRQLIMNTMRSSFQKLLYYPSAVVGILVVFLLIFTAAYAMIKIPYKEAIRLWRGGEDVWYQKPEIRSASLDQSLLKTEIRRIFFSGNSRWHDGKDSRPGGGGHRHVYDELCL